MGQALSTGAPAAAPSDLDVELRVRSGAKPCRVIAPASLLPHQVHHFSQIHASVPVERVIATAEAAGKAIMEIYNSEVNSMGAYSLDQVW